MNDYYTYCYFDEDWTPRYIGMGRGNRIDRKSHSTRHCERPPKERRVKLKENLTQEEGYRHEIYMISVLGRVDLGTGTLLNRTDGGVGMLNPSPEYRRRIGWTDHEDWSKKVTQKRSEWYEFTNIKTGEVLKEYTTIHNFCVRHNLSQPNLHKVLKGERRQHKGWSVRRVSP